jgi:hypothetical protein
MRTASIGLALLALMGCATAPAVAPREYQDDKTAATVTVVAKPWVFTRDVPDRAQRDRDAVTIYALDVNRAGEHHQYLAVLQTPPLNAPTDQSAIQRLDLQTANDVLRFVPVSASLEDIGLTQPIAEPLATSARWNYFQVSKEQLALLTNSSSVRPVLITSNERRSYMEFTSGRVEMAQFGEALR